MFFPVFRIKANSDFATPHFRTSAMRRNVKERNDVEYLEQRIQCTMSAEITLSYAKTKVKMVKGR